METTLWNFIIEIPQALAKFGSWLVNPINEKWLNISPLGLLGVAGTTFIIALIVVHVFKLFL